MRGYGASGLTRDTEADNWLKIAALSGKMNDEFTEESANMGANALMKGERLPDGMSDAARNQAYLAAPKLEEGAVFETKNNFLKQATEAAKAKGTTVDNILMNPPDDWFKNPMGYKAYASIAKDMSDANLNNGSAIKNYQAANVARFQQFDMSRTYIKDALARGDGDSAAAGLKKLVEESPVPFKLGDYDPQTRTFDVHELDMEKGSVVPASQRVSIDDVLKQTSSIGQAAFVSGATMASIIAKEKNAKSISDPQYFKDKSGKIYTGYTLINPNSLTDTTMHIRDQTTGKEVATLNDPSKLGEMGFSPFDVKFEKDHAGLVNEKKQGRNLDASYANLGAEGILKRLSIDDKKADMAYQEEIRPYQIAKTKNEAIESGFKLRGETSKELNKNLDETFKALVELGVQATPEVSSLVRGLPSNMTPTEKAQHAKMIVEKTDPIKDEAEKKKAYEDMVAAAHGVKPEVLAIRNQYPNATKEELSALVKQKAAESQKRTAEEAAAKQNEIAAKESERLFKDIADTYERLKLQSSSTQYGGEPVTDAELWKRAAQEPIFGKGLYDLQNEYFKDKKPEEMLGMVMQWYEKKNSEEAEKARASEVSRLNKGYEKSNKKSFYNYGAGSMASTQAARK